ncbi:MAG: hypothetical protein JXA04_08760 [Gammaproteobacteria bacterium]|nr:hypothetical protein [Gammaproteobacteria bacterium]
MPAWTLRAVGHDLSDPITGYDFGAKAEFLNFEYRVSESSQQSGLERFDILNISSYKPINYFFKPISWDFHISRQRKWIDDGRELVTSIGGALGYAVGLSDLNLVAKLDFDLDYSGLFDDKFKFQHGVSIGIFKQLPKFSFAAGYSYMNYADGAFNSVNTEWTSFGYHFGQANSLNFNISHDSSARISNTSIGMKYMFYF